MDQSGSSVARAQALTLTILVETLLGLCGHLFSSFTLTCFPESLTKQSFPEATKFPGTKLKQAYQPELDLKAGDLSKKIELATVSQCLA